MRKFLWINPVASEMYDSPSMRNQLMKKGFELVSCTQDHIACVKGKYHLSIEKSLCCIADMRCPLAVSYIKEQYTDLYLEYPDIEPILIHCARELQKRLEGKGDLYITTPCASLRDFGNSLGLAGVNFYTWNEFAQLQGLLLQKRMLEASPIPPGFFLEYGTKVRVLDSKEKIDRYLSSMRQQPAEKILELLYCSGGCHNGDGI